MRVWQGFCTGSSMVVKNDNLPFAFVGLRTLPVNMKDFFYLLKPVGEETFRVPRAVNNQLVNWRERKFVVNNPHFPTALARATFANSQNLFWGIFFITWAKRAERLFPAGN